jgi:hypothetical protein
MIGVNLIGRNLSDEMLMNRLPKLGEDKPSPLLWTDDACFGGKPYHYDTAA